MCVGCLLFLPALLGDVSAEAWPYVIASAALELLYFALLALAYSKYELSSVYPLARGSAPVFVLVVGGVSLALQAVGVVLVACGVLLVRGLRRGNWEEKVFGLAVGFFVAGYNAGGQHRPGSSRPPPYLRPLLFVAGGADSGVVGR